ncbi:hypothetical protein PGAL8A_00448700 [Plasmodium gallinaceum]|uniref:Uncharacterized protein n=1 Tax=Plasmodium gallinaceum TaxID=5849 RepID=A0A1J1H044_PLAGA|nr:hypothetical protein PGAL8A_00448700 [Plasmodium gallinaceum]CRG96906.1 hypothetical protein PGAL8A_00448700 [Plasmodium gallinaceum]
MDPEQRESNNVSTDETANSDESSIPSLSSSPSDVSNISSNFEGYPSSIESQIHSGSDISQNFHQITTGNDSSENLQLPPELSIENLAFQALVLCFTMISGRISNRIILRRRRPHVDPVELGSDGEEEIEEVESQQEELDAHTNVEEEVLNGTNIDDIGDTSIYEEVYVLAEEDRGELRTDDCVIL